MTAEEINLYLGARGSIAVEVPMIRALIEKVKTLEDRIAELEKHSHPPVDFSPWIERIKDLEKYVTR